ncbi:MAG: glycerol-3-phosphate 1-O-acyltransferase PlsY [Opitutaceae bacterium]
MLFPILIAAVVGYLLGSLPFGYLIARAKGVNIFEVGSKNPGATNVLRVLGKGPGYLAFFLDMSKGAVATGWPLVFCHLTVHNQEGRFVSGPSSNYPICAVAGLIGALLGHSFSCFLKFRGGKGVATTVGGFLVLLPLETLIFCAVWMVVFYAFRYVSLASILAAAALPAAAFFMSPSRLLFWLSAIVALFVVVRHRANIARLLHGTENKFAKKKEGSP